MKPTMILVLAGIILLGTMLYVIAEPVGPTALTTGASTRANINQSVKNVSAQAGNVTELNISANTITTAWQGYYGQITGAIVLADSSNNNFYNWSMTIPAGEVYASPNSSITWGSIQCFAFAANGSPTINLTMMEAQYGIGGLDADGINETFNTTNPSNVTIGTTTLENNTCPATYAYGSSGPQTTNFVNLLTTDGTKLVFTSIINSNIAGFNTNTYDFELLVAEDGHNASSSTVTPYFFWVELG